MNKIYAIPLLIINLSITAGQNPTNENIAELTSRYMDASNTITECKKKIAKAQEEQIAVRQELQNLKEKNKSLPVSIANKVKAKL